MTRYTVRLADPHLHRLEISLTTEAGSGPLLLRLPVWTPGSYLVQDYAGGIEGLSAKDARGRSLPWRKVGTHAWEIQPRAPGPVSVRYVAAATRRDTHGSWVDVERAILNGAGLYLYRDGRTAEPTEVSFAFPKRWQTFPGGLAPVPRRPGVFRAADYDELVDAPMAFGAFGRPEVVSFRVRGVPHRVVFLAPTTGSRQGLRRDLARTCAAAAAVFGEIPYRSYSFLCDAYPGGRGGLEHRDSTHVIVSPHDLASRETYIGLLRLFVHEHFHAWNVKRLRPEGLGPFDYSGPVLTPLLWVAEGWTHYYDWMIPRRTGTMTLRESLAEWALRLRRHRLTPGRLVQTLEETSEDAWVKYYRPHPDSPNATHSYYITGQLVAFLLDVEIRSRSGGRRSLDDVMRALWKRTFKRGRPYRPEQVEEAAAEAAGRGAGAAAVVRVFRSHVRGRQDIVPDGALAALGLRLVSREDPDAARAFLGARVRIEGERVVLGSVLRGTPAAAAGLHARDEVLAAGGWRVAGSVGALSERLRGARPGEEASLTVARDGRVREIRVRLGRRPPADLVVGPAPRATRAEKALFRGWARADWDEVKAAERPPSLPATEKVV
ncbi:MAG: PDZ domain-containing protein [Planctomycetales bacterium]|nr:PDZ domain-containing protein [Planctomycetales bacterium]